MRAAARRERGRVDIYQEAGHPHRFVLREIWHDRAAYDRHAMAASTSQFTTAVRPIHFGPIYVSVHIAYWMSPVKQGGANDAFVVTHVDVGGMNVPRLKEMLDKVGPASVNDAGLVRYEILDEVPAHPNHFRFFEQWTSEANWAAHHSSPHARAVPRQRDADPRHAVRSETVSAGELVRRTDAKKTAAVLRTRPFRLCERDQYHLRKRTSLELPTSMRNCSTSLSPKWYG